MKNPEPSAQSWRPRAVAGPRYCRLSGSPSRAWIARSRRWIHSPAYPFFRWASRARSRAGSGFAVSSIRSRPTSASHSSNLSRSARGGTEGCANAVATTQRRPNSVSRPRAISIPAGYRMEPTDRPRLSAAYSLRASRFEGWAAGQNRGDIDNGKALFVLFLVPCRPDGRVFPKPQVFLPVRREAANTWARVFIRSGRARLASDGLGQCDGFRLPAIWDLCSACAARATAPQTRRAQSGKARKIAKKKNPAAPQVPSGAQSGRWRGARERKTGVGRGMTPFGFFAPCASGGSLLQRTERAGAPAARRRRATAREGGGVANV